MRPGRSDEIAATVVQRAGDVTQRRRPCPKHCRCGGTMARTSVSSEVFGLVRDVAMLTSARKEKPVQPGQAVLLECLEIL